MFNLFTQIFTLPTAGEILSGIGAYSTTFWDSLLPFALMAVGLVAGVLILTWLINIIQNALARMFGYKSETDDKEYLDYLKRRF